MTAADAFRTMVFVVCLGAVAVGWGAPASRPKPITPTPQQRAEIRKFHIQAMGSDIQIARQAIAALQEMGDVARRDTLLVANRLLRRQRLIVMRAASRIRFPEKVSNAESRIAELRTSAWENIGKLDKGQTIQIAKENYTKLIEMHKALAPVYAHRTAVVGAMAMRAELVSICRDAGGQTAKLYTPQSEKKLAELAARALGMTLEQAAKIGPFKGSKGPTDQTARAIWHFSACRRIAKYNAGLWRHMSSGEAENMRLVNDYREALGALRYEIDPRLIQSARRHSKEMTDLNYFSHTSPTTANKSFGNRVRNAGHPSPAGENIAIGSRTGTGVFWMWFGSPGHHKNMVNRGAVAMGVGKWSGRWTQNMARGKRVMLMNKADRANVKIKGKVLRAQRP